MSTEVTARRARSKRLKPATLAHAIRIAAKMANEQPNPNPLFVEALEVAATHFDAQEHAPTTPRELSRSTVEKIGPRKYTRRVKKNGRRCAMVTCCGKTFPAGWRERHETGLLHRNYDLIRSLLSNSNVTNLEISKQLGCSRERVRQLITQLGESTATERSKARALRENQKAFLSHPLVDAFIKNAERNGLDWEPITTTDPCAVFHRKIKANGHTVQLRKTRYNRNGYVILHHNKSPEPVDFIAYLLQNTGEWIIVPWAERPKRQTMFAAEPNLDAIGMTTDNRHDWPQYLSAWHLLAEPKAE